MVKRWFWIAMVAVLVASLAAPLAVSSHSVKSRFTVSCTMAGWNATPARAIVADVRQDHDDMAPEDAEADLVQRIRSFYGKGCGDEIDAYVRSRVSSSAYSWYRAVVNHWVT